MKTKGFLIIISLFILEICYGQDKMAMQAQNLTDHLDQHLQFTEDQKSKVYNINMEMLQSLQVLRENRNTEALKETRKERMVRIKAILSESQLSKLETMKSGRQIEN